MPSLGDSAVIILLGLLLFGPKGLAQIARQLGKLMGEFRRASNEFRMQMDEELRLAEQADRQKEIEAIQAAAPPPAPILETPAPGLAADDAQLRSVHPAHVPAEAAVGVEAEPPIGEVEPVPIAVSGDLKIMPPSTGLPQARSSSSQVSSPESLAPLVDSIPHEDSSHHEYADQRPNRYTNGRTDTAGLTAESTTSEETLHG